MKAAATQNGHETDSPSITIEITAPKKGAVEKYAPVRAAPRPRKASTNSTRLTP